MFEILPLWSRMSFISPTQLKILELVLSCARELGFQLYLVGGVVRDILQGRSIADQDIDLVVDGRHCNLSPAAELARVVADHLGGPAKNSIVKNFDQFLTAKVILPSGEKFDPKSADKVTEIDFATARTESYQLSGKLPEVRAATLSEDLKRRDFTCNALAINVVDFVSLASQSLPDPVGSLTGVVIDQFNGLSDLESHVVRVLHERSFIDDPTRIFRAVRYATRFARSSDSSQPLQCISPETIALIKVAVQSNALATISLFRIFTELKLILAERDSALSVHALAELGILEQVPFLPASEFRESLRMELELAEQIYSKLNIEPQLGAADYLRSETNIILLFRASKLSAASEHWGMFGIPKRQLKRYAQVVDSAAKRSQDLIALPALQPAEALAGCVILSSMQQEIAELRNFLAQQGVSW